jgi:hypothetical protein
MLIEILELEDGVPNLDELCPLLVEEKDAIDNS